MRTVSPAFQDTAACSIALADTLIPRDMTLHLAALKQMLLAQGPADQAIQIALCISCPVLNVIYHSSNFCAFDPRTCPPAEITELEPVYSEPGRSGPDKPLILVHQALSTKLMVRAENTSPGPSVKGRESHHALFASLHGGSQISAAQHKQMCSTHLCLLATGSSGDVEWTMAIMPEQSGETPSSFELINPLIKKPKTMVKHSTLAICR